MPKVILRSTGKDIFNMCLLYIMVITEIVIVTDHI